jgi:hypothetical protein
MRRTLLGAFVGLVLGTFLGCSLAFALYRSTPNSAVWKWLPIQGNRAIQRQVTSTFWVDVANEGVVRNEAFLPLSLPVNLSANDSDEQERSNLNAFLFQGILFGGGFAALIGALAGATGAACKLIKDANRKLGPP